LLDPRSIDLPHPASGRHSIILFEIQGYHQLIYPEKLPKGGELYTSDWNFEAATCKTGLNGGFGFMAMIDLVFLAST
jgi:hypothetical protein